LFGKDRSKPLILSGETILEAARAGVARGEFGYAEKLEEREGKYVAVIREAPYRVEWDGFLVKQQLVYQEPATRPEQPPDEGGADVIGGQIGADLTGHAIFIRVESLSDALKRIREVRAYSPGRKLDARLSLTIQDEAGKIKVTVESSDWRTISTEAERLLGLIEKAGKYTTSGSIEVTTEDEGLVEELRGLGWS